MLLLLLVRGVAGSVWDQEVLVLELLVRHRVEEAAAAALRLGLLRLATLIPMAGQDPARELLAEQVTGRPWVMMPCVSRGEASSWL